MINARLRRRSAFILLKEIFTMTKITLHDNTFGKLSRNEIITKNGIYVYLCLKPFAVSSKEKERLMLCIIRIFI